MACGSRKERRQGHGRSSPRHFTMLLRSVGENGGARNDCHALRTALDAASLIARSWGVSLSRTTTVPVDSASACAEIAEMNATTIAAIRVAFRMIPIISLPSFIDH